MTNELNGATRLFPIIGDPIKYVESPTRLTRTFAEANLNAACVPMLVPEASLGPVMAGLAGTLNVDGILVTMPHKATVFSYCATNSERALLLGVVSVVRRNSDGSWHGDMLDGLAFVKAQKDRGAVIEGATAYLVGAGAAGSAIAMALLEAGVGELVIYDADENRSAHFVGLVQGQGDKRARIGTADPSGCDLVFNATPMGMEEGDPLPVDASLLTSSMFVGDVIAGHGETPFIAAAIAAGCTTANGDDMVVAVQNLMVEFMLGN